MVLRIHSHIVWPNWVISSITECASKLTLSLVCFDRDDLFIGSFMCSHFKRFFNKWVIRFDSHRYFNLYSLILHWFWHCYSFNSLVHSFIRSFVHSLALFRFLGFYEREAYTAGVGFVFYQFQLNDLSILINCYTTTSLVHATYFRCGLCYTLNCTMV